MNALFDEQNAIVLEYAGDAIIPTVVHDSMKVHHENLETEKVESILLQIGGSVHGHTIQIIKGDKNV